MNYIRGPGLKEIVLNALKEDISSKDITTESIIPKNKIIKAHILAKEDFVVCGLGVAGLVFKMQDSKVQFKALVYEGELVKKGKVIAQVKGNARPILSAERVALNFLCLLSGVATKTKEYVNAVKPYKVKIMDTRKTIPGLRELEKYAVRIGGGHNHRMALDEMILVKDNHLKIQNSKSKIQNLLENRKNILSSIEIEIEVKTLSEFKQALELKPDIIMLDNMSIKDMKMAVKIRNRLSPNTYHLTPKLEASGGITLKNVRQIASSGVDMISIGTLTHSVRSVDISLEII